MALQRLQVRRVCLSPFADDVVADFLPFIKFGQTSALDSADMDKNIWPAAIRLDEAKTLLKIEPLHLAYRHRRPLQV